MKISLSQINTMPSWIPRDTTGWQGSFAIYCTLIPNSTQFNTVLISPSLSYSSFTWISIPTHEAPHSPVLQLFGWVLQLLRKAHQVYYKKFGFPVKVGSILSLGNLTVISSLNGFKCIKIGLFLLELQKVVVLISSYICFKFK